MWEKYLSWFGYSVHVRIESPLYQFVIERLGQLAVVHGNNDFFRVAYECAVARYGENDPELIRIRTLADFMTPE